MHWFSDGSGWSVADVNRIIAVVGEQGLKGADDE